MDNPDFKDYLENRYNAQMKYFSALSAKNKKNYKKLQWSLIILSTLTTILAALPKTGDFDFHYAVIITAALVTILTAGLKTFQYQELWVNYRSTLEQLKPELYYYNFNVGDYGREGVDKNTLFVTRVEQILNKEHDGWPASKNIQNQGSQQQNEDALKNSKS